MSLRRFCAAGLVAALVACGGSAPAAPPHDDVLLQGGRIIVRDGSGRVASVASDGGDRRLGNTECLRVAAGGPTAVCLVGVPGDLPKTTALILDRSLHETRRVDLAGVPSRARVSKSGRMVAWTVFVTGETYRKTGFSTWTGILDTRTGYLVINIENIQLWVDGARYHAPDVNFWGVSFAADDNRFYATMASAGKTYLVEGDYAKWEAHTIAVGVECPSLSPDGRRIVFKQAVGGSGSARWKLAVMDLATKAITPLAETSDVDDQAVWLSGTTIGYALPNAATGRSDVWEVPADGSGSPRRLIADATSPTVD